MARTATGVTDALIIIEILKRIPRSSKISAKEIQAGLKAVGFDLRTRRLQRILTSIVESKRLGIEVDNSSRPYGYRKSVPQPDLDTTSIGPNEALLLRLSEEYLKNQLPRPLMMALEPSFLQAKEVFSECSALGKERAWMQKVAIASSTLPMMPPHINKNIFDAVTEALYRDAKLEVTYENSQGAQSTHTISPLGLVQQDARLYLVCQFDGFDNYRHLALHRIRKLQILDEKAVRSRNFSLKAYIRSRHFNYSNGEKVKLTVQFSNPVFAKNMEETPFNRTQTLTKKANGTWLLTAELDDSPAIDGWLATWKEDGGISHWDKKPIKS